MNRIEFALDLVSDRWCFTLNNYREAHDKKESDIDRIKEWENEYVCAIVGAEVCPTTGTPHYQGYIHFKKAISGFQLHEVMYTKRISWHKCFGSEWKNYKYCTKDCLVVYEFGEFSKQGKRTDLNEIKASILQDHKYISEILPKINNYQELKFAEGIMQYQRPEYAWHKKTVKWFYGKSGTGKTREAMELAGADFFITSRNLKWWDGYFGQRTVIIDDFRGDFCTFHELLRILDGYPFRVDIKRSSMWLHANTIIITSCYHPRNVYESREDIKQLLRRIDEIKFFDKNAYKTKNNFSYKIINHDEIDKKGSSQTNEACREESVSETSAKTGDRS